MSVFLSPVGGAGAQFFDNNGNPLTGGKLYTYAAGTTTPLTAYTTSAGNVAHTNPIVLDAAGRVPAGGEIWISENTLYKFVLETSTGVLIATWNDIDGINDPPDAFGIAYLPPFTGAVATTVGDELAQMVRLSDFGADETGVADSSTAISNALAYLGGIGGGTLELSNGAEYLVSSLVTMSQSNIVINGNGAKLKAVGSQGILDITGNKNTVRDVVFDHQNTAAVVTSLKLTGALNEVNRCTFNDVCEYSLEVAAAATDSRLIGNTFDKTDPSSFNIVVQGNRTLVDGNMFLNGDAGVVVNGNPEKVIVTNNIIKDQTEIGIDVIGRLSKQVTIAGNIISGCPLGGIRVGTPSAGGYYGDDVLVEGNQVIDCGANGAPSIAFTGNGTDDYRCRIADNVVVANAACSQGIIVTYASNIVVDGNDVSGAISGVYLNAGAKRCRIANNVVHDNTTYGIYSNLAILDPDGNNVIDGNLVYSNGTTSLNGHGIWINVGNCTSITNNIVSETLSPAKQAYGIVLAPNSNKCFLHGNKVFGNSTGPVLIQAPRTYTDYTWGDNFDGAGINKTRYTSVIGFPGTSTVTFNPDLWFAPRFVGGTADLNEFVWSSAVAANSVTLSRVASVGTLLFRTEVRV